MSTETALAYDPAKMDPAVFLKEKITNPVLAFKSDEDVSALVVAIRQMATEQAADIDVSTSTGRKSLVSVAAKVAKSRAFLKEVSTQAFKTLKAEADAVKIRGEKALEDLDELRDEIRQPVTDWEKAEAARVYAHNDALTQLRSIATQALTRYASDAEIDGALADLNALVGRNWDEFTEQANDLVKQATDALGAARDLVAQRAKEKAEREEATRRLAEEQLAKAEMERKLAEAQKAAAEAQKNSKALEDVERLYDVMARVNEFTIEEIRNDVDALTLLPPTGIQVLDRARQATLRTLKSVLVMKEKEAAKKAPMPDQAGFPWEQGEKVQMIVDEAVKAPEPPATPDTVAIIPVKFSDRDVVLALIHAANTLLEDVLAHMSPTGESVGYVEDLREAIEAAEQRFKA